jgi:hypothetical protein
MLQTNLKYQTMPPAKEGPCPGRLLLTWGLYAFAMMLLWKVFPHDSAWTAAALWGIAGVLALGLLVKLGEI